MKNKKIIKDKDDLIGEKNFMIEYLIENSEIDYTLFNLSMIVSISLFGVSLLMMLIPVGLAYRLIPLGLSVICFLWSRSKRTDFIMGNLGIDWTENIYNSEIKDKYNL